MLYSNPMTTYPPVDDWRVRINGREPHPLPHVHVQFRDGSRAGCPWRSILGGYSRLCDTPHKRLVPVRAWIEARRETLLAEYRRLNP